MKSNDTVSSSMFSLMKDLDNLKLLKVNEYSFCSETNLNQNLKVYQDIDADNDWYFWLYQNDNCIEKLNDDNFLSLTFKISKNKKIYKIKRLDETDLVITFKI